MVDGGDGGAKGGGRMKAEGLSRVSTEELQRLLRAMHRGVLSSPLKRSVLIATGFANVESHLGLLLGLDVQAAQRVVVATLAERKARAHLQRVL